MLATVPGESRAPRYRWNLGWGDAQRRYSLKASIWQRRIWLTLTTSGIGPGQPGEEAAQVLVLLGQASRRAHQGQLLQVAPGSGLYPWWNISPLLLKARPPFTT